MADNKCRPRIWESKNISKVKKLMSTKTFDVPLQKWYSRRGYMWLRNISLMTAMSLQNVVLSSYKKGSRILSGGQGPRFWKINAPCAWHTSPEKGIWYVRSEYCEALVQNCCFYIPPAFWSWVSARYTRYTSVQVARISQVLHLEFVPVVQLHSLQCRI